MSRTVGIVLAAGPSRRLGRPKQLLPYGRSTLVREVTAEVCRSACADVGVVIGANAGLVGAALAGLRVELVYNTGWRGGIASSIRRGLTWAARAGADAVLLCVADQPHLTAAHLDRLIEAHRAHGGVVASRSAGELGAPAVFDRAAASVLLRLAGDRGVAGALARIHDVTAIDWEGGAFDVDTPADAAALATLRLHSSGSGSGIRGRSRVDLAPAARPST